MRSTPILSDMYYHVFNRGNQKQKIFLDTSDYSRFLFLILHFQSPVTFDHLGRHVIHYAKHRSFKVSDKDVQRIISDRHIELLNFCIMPNHFHLTVHNLTEEGLSQYMHRVSNAYAKYFNTKYDKTGHVFQGVYKAIGITQDEQLTYLSAYIHRNSKELKFWDGKEHEYPWSSFQDYDKNRWGQLLAHREISQTFKSFQDYKFFVEESGAKERY